MLIGRSPPRRDTEQACSMETNGNIVIRGPIIRGPPIWMIVTARLDVGAKDGGISTSLFGKGGPVAVARKRPATSVAGTRHTADIVMAMSTTSIPARIARAKTVVSLAVHGLTSCNCASGVLATFVSIIDTLSDFPLSFTKIRAWSSARHCATKNGDAGLFTMEFSTPTGARKITTNPANVTS